MAAALRKAVVAFTFAVLSGLTQVQSGGFTNAQKVQRHQSEFS